MFDLLIIGGGINGAGIARDAAGRGLKVLVCEMNDLASATSSASTKLIHGGLRYLEHYEFSLVRESLKEREVLLRSAPHLVKPMRFILPHRKGLRPAWIIRLGLFLYDHIGSRKHLPGSRRMRLLDSIEGKPLQQQFAVGFEYSDCWVDDARLVLSNLLDAHARGAEICTRTEFLDAQRGPDSWSAQLRERGGAVRKIEARAIVNAGGPWVDAVLQRCMGEPGKRHVRLVKGSHIIVPRLFSGEHAYLLQHPDGRIGFMIPYLHKYTLIGTTDVAYEGDPAAVSCSTAEIDYLCELANDYLLTAISAADVVSTYAGVRPLYDDGNANASAITRDYVLDLRGRKGNKAPLLSVYGGKITTFRKLAEEALAKLQPILKFSSKTWTEHSPLSGGDIRGGLPTLLAELHQRYPWLSPGTRERLARAYGSAVADILGDAATYAELGHHFGADLYAAEIEWMQDQEWACSADDVLWRRSKLGMALDATAVDAVQAFLDSRTVKLG